ncbi:hypothetical protein L603_003100000100 [Cellulosimicrobium cellulans J34]|nr:hypothetical protein L603_003100000100 [Cellulosimicrobium cellulans J34]SMF37989.1 hypothetical protein SAMN02744115_02954 [Cellulosimicrobium cellulans J1]
MLAIDVALGLAPTSVDAECKPSLDPAPGSSA